MTPTILHCPECGYSLEWLPARHRCPECGFDYDERTRVWKPGSPRYIYLAVILTYSFFWMQIIPNAIIFMKNSFRGWWDGICWVISIPLTGVFLVAIWRAFHANRRGRYVAIGPNALHIRTTAQSVVIPWERIQSIACDREKLSRLSIEVDNDADRNALKPIIRSSERASSIGAIIPQLERAEFAAAVNKVLREARRSASGPQQESHAANHPTVK